LEKAVYYQGRNGEDHRFAPLDMTNPRALPERGGVVVIAKGSGDPLYIADTPSVRELLSRTDVWRRAQQEHGADGAYVSASTNAEWCRSTARDLREHYEPPMNSVRMSSVPEVTHAGESHR
jgi:hypothetical protein